MSERVTARIRATAARLGLPHLTGTLTGHVERADAAQMGCLDFLDLILEEELAVREERRLRHALRASKMPHHKTLDDYDFLYAGFRGDARHQRSTSAVRIGPGSW